jgi:hypothetical protein
MRSEIFHFSGFHTGQYKLRKHIYTRTCPEQIKQLDLISMQRRNLECLEQFSINPLWLHDVVLMKIMQKQVQKVFCFKIPSVALMSFYHIFNERNCMPLRDIL